MTPEFDEPKNIFKIKNYHAHTLSRFNPQTRQQSCGKLCTVQIRTVTSGGHSISPDLSRVYVSDRSGLKLVQMALDIKGKIMKRSMSANTIPTKRKSAKLVLPVIKASDITARTAETCV
jgi:hypothetical protein